MKNSAQIQPHENLLQKHPTERGKIAVLADGMFRQSDDTCSYRRAMAFIKLEVKVSNVYFTLNLFIVIALTSRAYVR